MDKLELTRDLQIIHLSDIHFGDKHICNPFVPGSSSNGLPKLHELILQDLNCEDVRSLTEFRRSSKEPETPVVAAFSGDFTQRATEDEYKQALEFTKGFVNESILGSTLILANTFVVPGNHDVLWDQKDPKTRFERFLHFYNELYEGARQPIPAHKTETLNFVHVNRSSGFVFLELNSCLFVERETAEASRGQIDYQAIAQVRKELAAIEPDFLESCIKIAMIHHHPVLLPTLVEPDKAYDAVVNANSLLQMLNDFGFHLLLHGHKHYPQVFSYDPQLAWAVARRLPQIVVAGGSCGSSELPQSTSATNCYNIIDIKLHPKSNQARVQIITRGLVRIGPKGVLDPDQWRWKTEAIVDRILNVSPNMPSLINGFGRSIGRNNCRVLEAPLAEDPDELKRKGVYLDQNDYLATCEVIPSLVPGQAYEARAWIVAHRTPSVKIKSVVWSCGIRFPKKECAGDPAGNYAVSFQYWGPMLIQAKMHFENDDIRYAYVYARLPQKYS